MKRDFTTLSLDERQIILVASDATYAKMCERVDYSAYAREAVLQSSNFVSAYRFVRWFIGKQPANPQQYRVVDPQRIAIPHLAAAEARRRFRFAPGEPADGQFYVRHPLRGDYYIKPADSARRLMREKFGVFQDVTRALGGRSIRLLLAKEDQKAGGLDFQAKEAAARELGIQASFNAGASESHVQITSPAYPVASTTRRRRSMGHGHAAPFLWVTRLSAATYWPAARGQRARAKGSRAGGPC